MEGEPKRDISPQEAAQEIQSLMDTEMRKGAVDTEGYDFRMILEDLQTGKISPKEALKRAQGIANSRQDYH